MSHRLILYAPSVHTGGGFVLLRALLSVWQESMPLIAFLDARARGQFRLAGKTHVSWVRASVDSRLKAELGLYNVASSGDTVLCFHGLPPLLPSSAKVVVFQQNRNYLGLNRLSQFSWKTRLRLVFERLVSRAFRHRVSEYIVQTPSMQRAMTHWYSATSSTRMPQVKVLPFIDAIAESHERTGLLPQWDFIYAADGEAHKNHRVLLAAWRLLAHEGLRPSLILTLGPRDEALKCEVEAACVETDLRIQNLGQLPRAEVVALYTKARAMIFPSTSESFGLPLVEAARVGLPILAPELDYVRDVCIPVHTFDPASPVSVARAVKRFLGNPEPTVTLITPTEFWSELLQECRP